MDVPVLTIHKIRSSSDEARSQVRVPPDAEPLSQRAALVIVSGVERVSPANGFEVTLLRTSTPKDPTAGHSPSERTHRSE